MKYFPVFSLLIREFDCRDRFAPDWLIPRTVMIPRYALRGASRDVHSKRNKLRRYQQSIGCCGPLASRPTGRAGGPIPLKEEDREIHAAVAPQPGDIVVEKHRVSAFFGSGLDMILRPTTSRRLCCSSDHWRRGPHSDAFDADCRAIVLKDSAQRSRARRARLPRAEDRRAIGNGFNVPGLP